MKQKLLQIEEFKKQKANIKRQEKYSYGKLQEAVKSYLKEEKAQEEERLKANLRTIVKNFSKKDIKNLLAGSYKSKGGRKEIIKLKQKEEELEKRIKSIPEEQTNYISREKASRLRQSRINQQIRIREIAQKYGMAMRDGIERWFTPMMWASVMERPLGKQKTQKEISEIFRVKRNNLEKELERNRKQQRLEEFKEKMNKEINIENSISAKGETAVIMKAKALLKRINKLSNKSEYFYKLKEKISLLEDLEQEKKKLEAESKKSPYQGEISRLRSKITNNNITFGDKLKNNEKLRAAYLSIGGWIYEDGFIKGRRQIGRVNGKNSAPQKFWRALSSINNYSPIYGGGGMLKYLAKEAYERTKSSFGGWQNYYHEHPRLHLEKQRIIDNKLSKLYQAEDERQDEIKNQIEFLEKQQEESLEELVEARTWLGQDKEEKKKNSFTKKIITEELKKYTIVEKERGLKESFDKLMDKFSKKREEVVKKYDKLVKEPLARAKNGLESFETSSYYESLQEGLRKLKYFATPKGAEYAARQRGRISYNKSLPGNYSRIEENDITKNYRRPTTETEKKMYEDAHKHNEDILYGRKPKEKIVYGKIKIRPEGEKQESEILAAHSKEEIKEVEDSILSLGHEDEIATGGVLIGEDGLPFPNTELKQPSEFNYVKNMITLIKDKRLNLTKFIQTLNLNQLDALVKAAKKEIGLFAIGSGEKRLKDFVNSVNRYLDKYKNSIGGAILDKKFWQIFWERTKKGEVRDDWQTGVGIKTIAYSSLEGNRMLVIDIGGSLIKMKLRLESNFVGNLGDSLGIKSLKDYQEFLLGNIDAIENIQFVSSEMSEEFKNKFVYDKRFSQTENENILLAGDIGTIALSVPSALKSLYKKKWWRFGGGGSGVGQTLADFVKTVKTKTFKVLDKYKNIEYSPKFGQNLKLKGKVINENAYYKLADDSDLLFDAPTIMKKYSLKKIRHSVRELPDLLKKADADSEIMYVLKENGELVFSIRSKSSSYLPHPVLSKGEGVKVAGTLEKQGDVWIVTNSSGYFKPSKLKLSDKNLMEKLLKKVSSEINKIGINTKSINKDYIQ